MRGRMQKHANYYGDVITLIKTCMKNTILFLSGLLLLLAACNKDDNGIQIQPHNSNAMMTVMHQMMDSMDMMAPTNDPEIDFAMMMTMHHQGAINMANLELQQGNNDSLKRTAQKVIDMQTMEIAEFNAFLASNSVDNSDPSFAMEQMDNMDKMGSVADAQLITGDTDNDFATLMMVHHQSAMDNASSYLHHGNNATLKTMAENIISAQTMEIEELSNWLQANKR